MCQTEGEILRGERMKNTICLDTENVKPFVVSLCKIIKVMGNFDLDMACWNARNSGTHGLSKPSLE